VGIDAQAVTPGEWQCGVRRLAVGNGPNIFQMPLVFLKIYPNDCEVSWWWVAAAAAGDGEPTQCSHGP